MLGCNVQINNRGRSVLASSGSSIPDYCSSKQPYVCADCSADDPQWASLNKGVLICSECCYVHRNLGRHISCVRSLKKGAWDSNQLQLMFVLYSSGSNNIWEHSLIDPLVSGKTKNKPSPHDPIWPVKEDFIKSKYVQMAFTLFSREEGPLNQDDLNRQLWSCVRTSHVETTLRLLSLGADPNYADHEKQNTPLHIAAKEGQPLQVELLCIYGADAGQLNAGDLSPSQVAKLENNTKLAVRLRQLEFEVTNRLTMFLCGRKPDHSRQQLFLIPELTGQSNLKELSKYRILLQRVPPLHFERILQDVYDEVDRRETVAAWNAIVKIVQPIHLGNDQCVAVFLPPNPEFSAIRNQLRQKLAKYDVYEFAAFLIDVLHEVKRRYYGLPINDGSNGINGTKQAESLNQSICNPTFSDEMKLSSEDIVRDYDDVAGTPPVKSRTPETASKCSSDRKTMESDGSVQDINAAGFSIDNYLEIKNQLTETENKLTAVKIMNSKILRMMINLQSTVDHLTVENTEFRGHLQSIQHKLTECVTRQQQQQSSSSKLAPDGSIAMTSGKSGSACQLYPVNASIESFSSKAPNGIINRRRHTSLTSPSAAAVESYHDSDLKRFDSNKSGDYNNADNTAEKFSVAVQQSGFVGQRTRSFKSSYMERPIHKFTVMNNLIMEVESLIQAIKRLLNDAKFHVLAEKATIHAQSIADCVNGIVAAVSPLNNDHLTNVYIPQLIDASAIFATKSYSAQFNDDEKCRAACVVANIAKNLLKIVHEI